MDKVACNSPMEHPASDSCFYFCCVTTLLDNLVGTYQGQWLRGMRHGYGVRASAPFGLASHYKPPKQVRASLTSLRSADGGPAVAPTPEPTDRRDRRVDDSRGGFVLKARSDDPPARRKSLTEKSLKKGILSVRHPSREGTKN